MSHNFELPRWLQKIFNCKAWDMLIRVSLMRWGRGGLEGISTHFLHPIFFSKIIYTLLPPLGSFIFCNFSCCRSNSCSFDFCSASLLIWSIVLGLPSSRLGTQPLSLNSIVSCNANLIREEIFFFSIIFLICVKYWSILLCKKFKVAFRRISFMRSSHENKEDIELYLKTISRSK